MGVQLEGNAHGVGAIAAARALSNEVRAIVDDGSDEAGALPAPAVYLVDKLSL